MTEYKTNINDSLREDVTEATLDKVIGILSSLKSSRELVEGFCPEVSVSHDESSGVAPERTVSEKSIEDLELIALKSCFFDLWIHLAATEPSYMAIKLANCTTEEDYKEAFKLVLKERPELSRSLNQRLIHITALLSLVEKNHLGEYRLELALESLGLNTP